LATHIAKSLSHQLGFKKKVSVRIFRVGVMAYWTDFKDLPALRQSRLKGQFPNEMVVMR
jgi:hypothetical protein